MNEKVSVETGNGKGGLAGVGSDVGGFDGIRFGEEDGKGDG